MFPRPRIGLLGLTLQLYQRKVPECLPGLEKFSVQLSRTLTRNADVFVWPMSWDKTGTGQAAKLFQQKKVDGVIVVFLSYASSLSHLPVLKELNRPILLWNTQKLNTVSSSFGPQALMENHGLHGIQDLASVLLREGINFTLITGHWRHRGTLREIGDWCLAAAAAGRLSQSRVGRVGGRFRNMGDFALPDDWLRQQLGLKIIDISSNFLKTKPAGKEEPVIRKDGEDFQMTPSVNPEIKAISFRAASCLKDMMIQKNLSAVAINFSGLKKGQVMPFLGICQLLAGGYGYGGEGDVFSATAVWLAQLLSAGQATFTEMFTADFLRQRILMNHMGEASLKLRRPDFPVKLAVNPMKLGNQTPTLVPVFTLKPGPATLINLTGTATGLRLLTSQVEVLEGPLLRLDSPHFFIRPHQPVADFLTAYSLAGGSHHLALSYGDSRNRLRYLSQMKKLDFLEI